jgi:hypothetical protein
VQIRALPAVAADVKLRTQPARVSAMERLLFQLVNPRQGAELVLTSLLHEVRRGCRSRDCCAWRPPPRNRNEEIQPRAAARAAPLQERQRLQRNMGQGYTLALGFGTGHYVLDLSKASDKRLLERLAALNMDSKDWIRRHSAGGKLDTSQVSDAAAAVSLCLPHDHAVCMAAARCSRAERESTGTDNHVVRSTATSRASATSASMENTCPSRQKQ